MVMQLLLGVEKQEIILAKYNPEIKQFTSTN